MMREVLATVAILAVVGIACEPSEGMQEDASKRMCEEFVKDRLKAPTTAEFYDATTTNVRGDTWKVDGYVDSENTFGGMVKNRYLCTVTNTEGDTWHLESMSGLVN